MKMILVRSSCKGNLSIYRSEDFEEPRMMKVSRQTISAIETGKYNPSLELAFAISNCFGEPIEKIFLYHDDALVDRR